MVFLLSHDEIAFPWKNLKAGFRANASSVRMTCLRSWARQPVPAGRYPMRSSGKEPGLFDGMKRIQKPGEIALFVRRGLLENVL